MRKSIPFSCLFVLAIVFLFAPTAGAVVSLDGSDSLDVLIKVDGAEEHVTCIRDAYKPLQWYYVPSRIRLEEMVLKSNGKKIPVFSLVKYQAKDPKNPQELLEGGVLQCSVNLALPPGALDQAKKQIADAKKVEVAKLLLAPLEMMDAKLTIYSPGGEKLGEAPQAPDFAPAFANQSIPIQINLNRLGADFTSALATSNTGVPVNITFQYQGLTPKAGFKVKMNLEKAAKHYSSDSKSKESWNNWHRGWWGYWYGGGGNRDTSTTVLREDLTKSGSIEIEKTTSETLTAEMMDKYIDPVFEKMQAELFEPETPEKIEPAKAAEPTQRGSWWYSSGSTLSVKDISKVKKTTIEFNMSERKLTTRLTSVGGCITLANWPKEVQDQCIVVMPAYNWTSAWYTLPDLGDTDKLNEAGITQIAITVDVQDKNGKQVGCPQQSVVAKVKDGFAWKDAKGNDRSTLLFALAGVYDKFKGREGELTYFQKFEIQFKPGKSSITAVAKGPMFDGEAAVSTPMSGVTMVELDGNLLTYYGDKYPDSDLIPEAYRNQSSDLTDVKLVVTNLDGKNKDGRTLPPYNATIRKNAPLGYVVVDRGGLEFPTLKGVLTFNSKKFKNKTVTYDNMLELGMDSMTLTDGDLLQD